MNQKFDVLYRDSLISILQKTKEKCKSLLSIIDNPNCRLGKTLRAILVVVSGALQANGFYFILKNAKTLIKYRKYLNEELIFMKNSEGVYEGISTSELKKSTLYAGIRVLLGLLGTYLAMSRGLNRRDSFRFRKDGIKEALLDKVDKIKNSINSFSKKYTTMSFQERTDFIKALLETLKQIIITGINARNVYEAIRCCGKLREGMKALASILIYAGVKPEYALKAAVLMRLWQGIIGAVMGLKAMFKAIASTKSAVGIITSQNAKRKNPVNAMSMR